MAGQRFEGRYWFFVYAVMVAVMVAATARGEIIYINHQYGLQAALPSGFTICTDAPPAPDHGVAVVLDQGSCSALPHAARLVSVFASYNTAEEADGNEELAAAHCQAADIEMLRRPMLGSTAVGCRFEKDGAIEYSFYVQRQFGDNEPKWLGYVNYVVSLKTSSGYVSVDTDVLDAVIASLKFVPLE